MSDIEELLRISNRDHNRMSGLAKLLIVISVASAGVSILFWGTLMLVGLLYGK